MLLTSYVAQDRAENKELPDPRQQKCGAWEAASEGSSELQDVRVTGLDSTACPSKPLDGEAWAVDAACMRGRQIKKEKLRPTFSFETVKSTVESE